MLRETQEAGQGLSADADGRADAVASSRRGFLSGTGLAAVGAVIGGGMPFSSHPGLIPAASAQGATPAPAKGPQYLKFPGKNEGLVRNLPVVADVEFFDRRGVVVEQAFRRLGDQRLFAEHDEAFVLAGKFQKLRSLLRGGRGSWTRLCVCARNSGAVTG